MKRKLLIIPAALVALICMGASSCDTNPANKQEQQTQQDIQKQYDQNQPLPQFNWSQYRETLIDIETAQAKTVQTTTFAFNQGVATPVWSCPSVGFPIASTSNLSNPSQIIQQDDGNGHYYSGTVGQMDPNGVYQGDSTGTYVVCVAPDGSNSIHYWEGYTDTVTGPAVWQNGQVTLTGPSTVHVKTKP